MNVPADDPNHVTLVGGLRDRLFKAADILDRILHPLLQIGGKRPIGQAEAATHAVENDVGLQQQLICAVAEEGEPARIKHEAVEHVAMDPQPIAPDGGDVKGIVLKRHNPDMKPGIISVESRLDGKGRISPGRSRWYPDT